MKRILRRRAVAILLAAMILFGKIEVYAKGPTYTPMQDVYYTKEACVVYAEPTYTSTVLATIGANIPVQVVGAYSNGWYRINIGVICYVKMDSAHNLEHKEHRSLQVCGSQAVGRDLFGKHISKNIHIMIHNSSKIIVMK